MSLLARRHPHGTLGLLVISWFANWQSCQHAPREPGTSMCGKCAGSAQCGPSLRCVNGVCETAPPSCHVQIGL